MAALEGTCKGSGGGGGGGGGGVALAEERASLITHAEGAESH